MPKRPEKRDEAAVTSFADHEVITPVHTLKSYARRTEARADDPGFDEEAVARAEEALAALSAEFDGWMEAEVARLAAARQAAQAGGLTGTTRTALYLAAHDIKGEAATFGYPLAAAVGESLCRLLDGIAEDDKVPLALVAQHVEAIGAIVRENAKGEHPVARALAEELAAATDRALVAAGGSPSIVP